MAESRLPSSEEARIRTAALVAAQRMSWDVPRHVLDYIVATSDPRQGPAALEMRAAGIVEYVKNHPSAPDFANASDREAQSFFRMIHGQVVSRFGGLPWALALAREEEASDRSAGSAAYNEALVGDAQINSANYHRSRFGNRGVGVPEGVYHDLLGQGYTRDQIYTSGRQANLLGFRGDQRMIRAQALIQRYDSDAGATNRAMLAYREAIELDRELADLMARANTTTGEARREIEAQIRRRYQHLRETHGVEGRLTDPANDERAKGGIRESDDLLRRRLEDGHGFRFQFGAEAAQAAPDAEIVAVVPTPTPEQTAHITSSSDSFLDDPAPTPGTPHQAADATVAPARPGQGRQVAQTVQPSGSTLTR